MHHPTVLRSLKLSLSPRNLMGLLIIWVLVLSVHPAAASSTVLYVLNGGTLSQTAGAGATTNSIPSAGGVNHDGTPTNPVIYTLSGVNGTYDNTKSTAFSLYLDAGTAVGNGTQAQVQYDFTGDGTWDRTETYNYFATDPVAGFELYTQASGLKSSTGTFTNLSNGKVRIQVWSAIGNAASTLRVSATGAQGQQSTVTVPFALGGGGATNTPTNTSVGPTPTRTNTSVGPTPTRTNTSVGPTPTRTNTPVGPTPTRTNTPAGATPFWGDTASIPPASQVLMFHFVNRTNGQYPDNQIYWTFNGQTHTIADTPNFDMPANSAGRMYFYLGSPTSQYNDFIEFTIGPDVFNGNTTRVDWFGVKLAMRLHAHDGYDVSVGEDLATFQESRTATFQKFVNEVPAAFDALGTEQSPFRIPAPGKMGDTTFAPGGPQANYFASYAASVGVSATTQDIFWCAGPLATNAATCSAVNRHVAQLPQSQWTDSTQYYLAAPANYYAKFWHDHAINKLAYGFPYDDYGGYSSFISHGDPQWLVVAIGW